MTALLLTGLPATAQSIPGEVMSKALFVSKYGNLGLLLAALALFVVLFSISSFISFRVHSFMAFNANYADEIGAVIVVPLAASILLTAIIFLY